MPRKIAVMTSYMHQRSGDLVAAMSFIKSILVVDPTAEFEWVVKRDISGFNRDLQAFMDSELGELSGHVKLTCINSSDYQNADIIGPDIFKKGTNKKLTPDELTKLSDANWGLLPKWYGWSDIHQTIAKRPLSDQLKACDMIAVVGNPHRMIKSDYDLLHGFKKPIKLIPEYDLVHTKNSTYRNPNAEIISTGFKGHGVYIDETATAEHRLDEASPIDADFITHLTGDDIEQYYQNNYLYYGYFFDDETKSPSEYAVNVASYISNCIMLAMDQDEKTNIDIVIPGFKDEGALKDVYQRALDKLPQAYRERLGSVDYDVREAAQFDTISMNDTSGEYQLRLINPRRLERKTVQALLNDSEPWVGLTGDASWIEGLMKGKIVCYQVVLWKQAFFNEFMAYLSKKMPKSHLLAFYRLQGNNRQPSDSNFESMRQFYIKNCPQMQQEARELAELIRKEKNLSCMMGRQLIKDMPKESGHKKSKVSTHTRKSTKNNGTVEEKNPKLEQFIAFIYAHLDGLPSSEYVFNYFKSAHQPAKETLRLALVDDDRTPERIIGALKEYYEQVSRRGLFVGNFTQRHKLKFEDFMISVGVLADHERNQLQDKLDGLNIDDFHLDGPKDAHLPDL